MLMKLKKGFIRVPEEEGDRIDALQACEKEDTLIEHGTVRMIMQCWSNLLHFEFLSG